MSGGIGGGFFRIQTLAPINPRVFRRSFETFWEYDYYHPDQKGSTSLKTILPVITGRDYKDLGIQSGQMANFEFLRIKTEFMTEFEKSEIEKNLIEYCKLDTYAMILILRKIKEWIETPL